MSNDQRVISHNLNRFLWKRRTPIINIHLFIVALYGSLFSKESDAAFCNYRMWESIGFIIAFAYSSFLCTSVKLYVTLSGLIIGMIGYGIVEYRIRKSDMSVKEKKELKYEIKDLKSIKSKDPSSLVNGIDNKAFSTHM